MSNKGGSEAAATDEAANLQLLTEELYASLKRLARAQRSRLRVGETMQTTAVVSEAYLKLSRHSGWKSRDHFLNTAARVMRQVLVDYARAHLAAKRGGWQHEDSIDEVAALLGEPAPQVLGIDTALGRLEQVDPRLARIVECRFFAGYSDGETARLLDLSARTVQRDWLKAKAWLYQELEEPPA